MIALFVCQSAVHSEESRQAVDPVTMGEARPENGLVQQYLDLGGHGNAAERRQAEERVPKALTKMIQDNPSGKVFWLQIHKWGDGLHDGKNISHQKLVYFRETKELIFMQRQELSFGAPRFHETWHEWAHWKDIEPKDWEKGIPFEENEFKSDYDPRTALKSFTLSFPLYHGLVHWP